MNPKDLSITEISERLRQSLGLSPEHDSTHHATARHASIDDARAPDERPRELRPLPRPLVSGEIVHRELSYAIVGAAIAVHRATGPGQLESLYEAAMCEELRYRGLAFERQAACPASYRSAEIGTYYADLVVENKVVVELKSVHQLLAVHRNQSRISP